MIAVDNVIEVGMESTAKGPDLACDEFVCIFYKPIASGLTTYRVFWHSFVTSVLFNFVAHSYYGGFVVCFEDDIGETCCVDVLKNLLGDKIVGSLFLKTIVSVETWQTRWLMRCCSEIALD